MWEATLKIGLFPVPRVAKTISHSGSQEKNRFPFSFFGKKITEMFTKKKKKKLNRKFKKKVPSRHKYCHPASTLKQTFFKGWPDAM